MSRSAVAWLTAVKEEHTIAIMFKSSPGHEHKSNAMMSLTPANVQDLEFRIYKAAERKEASQHSGNQTIDPKKYFYGETKLYERFFRETQIPKVH